MKDRIEEVLDTIRPTLQADGGDVELIDFNEGIVTVRIDPKTGLRAPAGMRDAIFEVFREENVPEQLVSPALPDPHGDAGTDARVALEDALR